MKKALVLLTFLALTAFLCIPAMAADTPFKTYVFSKKKVSKDWSPRKTVSIKENRALGLFNDRNKRYSSQTVLTIKDIPAQSSVKVKFTMIYVGSWDSGGKLADRFIVSTAGGSELLNITEFPCLLENGDDNMPINNNGLVRVGERERAYWTQPLTFTIPTSEINEGEVKVKFRGYLTGRKTEFWAMDNVELYLN
ncbi:hypothetical protein [Maridesulfovibrio frigidus]|uniref:hypothetical protein n=1 Tax=Maridesulfovibrio frigidus TaxID=340956 RepID=UPI0004E1DD8D|nr:hypothetical protein [Maridesulfovibrio frigidus]